MSEGPAPRPPPVLLYLALPLLVLGLLVVLLTRYSAGADTVNLTMQDRDAVVTAQEVYEARGQDELYSSDLEHGLKERLARGALRISYRYGPGKGGVEVTSSVVLEGDELQARTTYLELSEALRRQGGEPGPGGLAAWGDESRLAVLGGDGGMPGSAYVGRKGQRVFTFRALGLPTGDLQKLERFILRKGLAVEALPVPEATVPLQR